MSIEDKRVQVCRMNYLPIKSASVRNHPGAKTIAVSGDWSPIPIASGEFKEKVTESGTIEQELKATVTNTGSNMSELLHDLLREEGLVILQFTNGVVRVVGTDEFPVLMNIEESGSVAAFNLSFKRNSPEPAKILKSF